MSPLLKIYWLDAKCKYDNMVAMPTFKIEKNIIKMQITLQKSLSINQLLHYIDIKTKT